MKYFLKLVEIISLTFVMHSCEKDRYKEDETIKDIDGNTYKTVTIGTQTWMAENLKTTKYRNGDLISTTPPATLSISYDSTSKYQWAYDDDNSNVAIYGRLYTWFTVTDGRNVCPTGWHLPNYEEWNMLITSLGENAGDKLRETGTVHWQSPNEGANNKSGFTALPGGCRMQDGRFILMGEEGFWHSSTDESGMFIDNTGMAGAGSLSAVKAEGFSIRCIKDGKEIILETLPVSLSSITSGSAIVGGSITCDGGYEITDRGVYWGTSKNPDLTGNKHQAGSGTGLFSKTLSGLNPNTIYYVIAYAINNQGIVYGNEGSFKTPQKLSVTTFDIADNTVTSATVGGKIPYDVGLPETITERGVYWSTLQNPELTGLKFQIGTGTGSFSSTLSGLNPDTEYFIKAYAFNLSDTAYGVQISFKTLRDNIPGLSTSNVASITRTTAVCGGSIIFDGGFPVIERGVFWGTSHHPETTGTKFEAVSEDNPFSVTLSGLIPGTEYFVRAYAVNSNGLALGSEINFRIGAITDIDGNVYNTVTITLVLAGGGYTNEEIWMKENLRVTKYNDGTNIQNVTGDTDWMNLTTPGYCWYNNDSAKYKNTYGALYNLKAVTSGKTLCPVGWRQALYNDYKDLAETYGGNSVAGGKLKSVIGWMSPNTGATDESGFSALPGGFRDGSTGQFLDEGYYGYFSEPTVYNNPYETGYNNTCIKIGYNNSSLQGTSLTKKDGLSVRCVK